MLFLTLRPIEASLKDIRPVKIEMVRKTSLEPLWNELVSQYHYLSHGKMPGANLKYLAFLKWCACCSLKHKAYHLPTQQFDYRLVCSGLAGLYGVVHYQLCHHV